VPNPTLFEGWSTAVEEAMTVGVPLLSSDLRAHREQAPENALFFDFGNVSERAKVRDQAWGEWPADPRPVQAAAAGRLLALDEHEVGPAQSRLASRAQAPQHPGYRPAIGGGQVSLGQCRAECSVLLRRDHGMRVAYEHHTAFASSSPCAYPLDRVRRINAVNGTPEHWEGSSDHVQSVCAAQASPSG